MNVREKVLWVSIAVIFVIFVHYGMNTFLKEPKYENFCNTSSFYAVPEKVSMASEQLVDYSQLSCSNITVQQLCMKINTQRNCDKVANEQRQKEQLCYDGKGQPTYVLDESGCNVYKDCNYCNKVFMDAQEKYNRIVFISAGIVGILALIIGAAILALESVGTGIMFGGVLTIIYGTIRYWGNLPDVGRFIILGIALVVLIWLGYKILASQGSKQKDSKVNKSAKRK